MSGPVGVRPHAYRQLTHPADEEIDAPGQFLHRADQTQLRESREQATDPDTSLDPPESGPQAVVDAVAERQMRVSAAVEAAARIRRGASCVAP